MLLRVSSGWRAYLRLAEHSLGNPPDGQALKQAHIILSAIPLGVGGILAGAVLNHTVGNPSLVPANLGCAALGLLVILMVRAGWLRLSGHALVWIAFALICFSALGPHPAGRHLQRLMVFVPLSVGFLIGNRALALYLPLIVAVAVDLKDGQLGTLTGQFGGPGNDNAWLDTVTTVIVLGVSGGLALIYNRRTEVALREARAALGRAEQEVETRRVAEARAREANRTKSAFLATMSHEVRTPLNGILGTAELMAKTCTGEDRELVRTIQSCGESLLVILNDILDVSKMEAGQLAIEQHPFDLGRAVHNAAQLQQGRAASNNITLSVSIEDDIPRWVLGDEHRISQILFNLIGNAVKFTTRGGVDVVVIRGHGAAISFEIIDSGPGIPVDVQTRLFKPFVQADDSTARRFGGTGLGLAICARLVHLMGGQIGLDSTVGLGSRFWFQLVLPETQPTSEASALAPTVAGPVLVVDDNLVNRKVASRLLENHGLEVVTCESGAEALEQARTRTFPLILMDIQMPEMDGYAATTALRALPEASTSAIIGLSANALPEDRARGIEVGMDDYLTKPFKLETVLRAAERAQAERAAEPSARVRASLE